MLATRLKSKSSLLVILSRRPFPSCNFHFNRVFCVGPCTLLLPVQGTATKPCRPRITCGLPPSMPSSASRLWPEPLLAWPPRKCVAYLLIYQRLLSFSSALSLSIVSTFLSLPRFRSQFFDRCHMCTTKKKLSGGSEKRAISSVFVTKGLGH